jgi:hypothetical protein
VIFKPDTGNTVIRAVQVSTERCYNTTSVATGQFSVSVSFGCLLPNTLLSFEATRTLNNSVLVTWQTDTEDQLSHFVLEHSADGVHFEDINTQNAHGGAEGRSYQFVDNQPFSPKSYYRLRYYDFSGYHKLSDIRAVDLPTQNTGILVYPNPSKGDALTIQLSNIDKDASLELRDAIGRLVWTQQYTHTGDNQAFINLNMNQPLAEGIYILSVNVGSAVQTKRVVIQK